MYASYYHLSTEPFRLSPDHRFCFQHPSYAKAKAYLQYGLHRAEGFIMVTGAPGTGKTTLIDDLLAGAVEDGLVVARLVSTQLGADDILRTTAFSFGLRAEGLDKATVLRRLEEFLVQQKQIDRRGLLVVDEAQDLAADALEELRLLTNLQVNGQPLLQIFLLGQEELREMVRLPAMEQLHQRMIAACNLKPLQIDETKAYVEARLRRADWSGDPAISSSAFRLIHQHSQGVPRRINQVCSRLFLHGTVEGKHELDAEDVRIVVDELREEHLFAERERVYRTATGRERASHLPSRLLDDTPRERPPERPHAERPVAEPASSRPGPRPVPTPVPTRETGDRVVPLSKSAGEVPSMRATPSPAMRDGERTLKAAPPQAQSGGPRSRTERASPAERRREARGSSRRSATMPLLFLAAVLVIVIIYALSPNVREHTSALDSEGTPADGPRLAGSQAPSAVTGPSGNSALDDAQAAVEAEPAADAAVEGQTPAEQPSPPQPVARDANPPSAAPSSTPQDASAEAPQTVAVRTQETQEASPKPSSQSSSEAGGREALVRRQPPAPQRPSLEEDLGRHSFYPERFGSHTLKLNLAGDLSFDFDSAWVKPAFWPTLDSLAQVLSGRDELSIHIVGHSDGAGQESYNLALSKRRAEAVAEYLMRRGIPAHQLHLQGRGSAEPESDEDSEAGARLNRRVDIYLRTAGSEQAILP